MKNATEYIYTFATGETVPLGKEQISEEWIHILEELDRVEYNNDHAETRRHCSLQARDPKGKVLVSGTDGFEELSLQISWEEMKSVLSERDREIAEQRFIFGYSTPEIGMMFGLSPRGAREAVYRIKNKLKKFSK